MNKFSRISLMSVLSFSMLACENETNSLLEQRMSETRTVAETIINLPQSPVYKIAAKENSNIYEASAFENTNSHYMTQLDVTISVPKDMTLTGVSFRASDDVTLCGQFACSSNGFVEAGKLSNNQLFVEFETEWGEKFVEMKSGDKIHFMLNIAPSFIDELDIYLHATGSFIYKTEVERDFVPGSVEHLELNHFSKIEGNQWLSMLDDDTPITRLSMPGTHDAATGEGTSLSLGVTQSLSLQQQWDMGIRVFDLRPGYKKVHTGLFKYENRLHIYHGVVETEVSFDQAIKCITANLQKNPDEFAVVLMQFENASLIYHDRNVWNSLMNDYLSTKLPQQFKVDYRPDLTLGEVRGKLLILSRDAYADKPVTGGFVSGWSFDVNGTTNGVITSANGTTSTLNVQDYYKVDNIDLKCGAVKKYIDLASSSETGRITFNHASGYTTNSTYHTGIMINASAANTAVYNYLTSNERVEGCVGFIMMDRVGVRHMRYGLKDYVVYGDLAAQSIIDNNFKFKLTK